MENPERELEVLAVEQTTVPVQTSVAVVTTAPALSSYGFTLAQATALVTSVNALVADVAAILTLLSSEHTASVTP